MELDMDTPRFEVVQWNGEVVRETQWLRFKDDANPSTLSFPTGNQDAAVESYRVYAGLRDEGVIGSNVRFQVSIPTPMATAYMYNSPNAREAYIPACERAFEHAISMILDAIPQHALAIQWDVCQEVLVFENYEPFGGRPPDYKQQIFDELARVGSLIPGPVCATAPPLMSIS